MFALRRRQLLTVKLAQRFECRTIAQTEELFGNVNSRICIDADEVGIEGGMIYFLKLDAASYDRLPVLFIAVVHDVGSIKQ